MGLGPLHTFSLSEARARARAARQQLADGINPLKAKRAAVAARALEAAKALSFEEAAIQYHESNHEKWKNEKHRAQFLASLRNHVFPKIGALPVAAIDTALVLQCIENLWKTKTETADRIRGRIENVLDYATIRGYRAGDNPARWKGHISGVLPPRHAVQRVQHHAALPFQEIAAFMDSLHIREGVAARALEFAILTAARTSEVLGATWDEIDLDAKVWIIPESRMKAKKEHRVPLSPPAVKLLMGLYREAGNPHVFIGTSHKGPLSNMAMSSVLKRLGRRDLTVHGFRSTYRDWAAETTTFENYIVEMALAHSVGGSVEKAYRRGDLFAKRVALMEAWAAYCTATPATVIPLRARR